MSKSEKLERLRAMAKSKPGTSGFSRADLAAIQMAVDALTETNDRVVVVLTRRQAEFLWSLLEGFICREAGGVCGTPSIIRQASQIGKRLSDAAGFNWFH